MNTPAPPRTTEQLWQEYFQNGSVTATAISSTVRMMFIGTLTGIGIFVIVGLFALNRFGSESSADGSAAVPTALILGLVGLVMLAGAAALLGKRMQTDSGPTWVISPAGISVDGVGPVPWSDLEPSRYRVERALYGDGHETVVAMPLTPAGREKAQAWTKDQQAKLNQGVKAVLLGPNNLESIRVERMHGISGQDWRWFLDAVRDRETGSGPTGSDVGSAGADAGPTGPDAGPTGPDARG